MLGGVGEALRAVTATAAVAAVAWVVGSALLRAAPPAERLTGGLCVVLGAAWLVMAQPVLGVSALAHPWALRALLVVAMAALAIVRPPSVPRIDWRRVALPGGVALAVSAPVWFGAGDAYPGADILWHEGWIRQLAGGMPAPGGIYADVPNAYPWLEHATAGLIMSLSGLGVRDALAALEFLMLLLLGLGTWLLARELELTERAAGWSSALAIGGGGIGWLLARGPAALLSVAHYGNSTTPPDLRPYVQGLGRYHGDLLLSPAPTPGLGNVPPAMPRELGLALLPVVLWLALRAVRLGSARWAIAAGAVGGFATLASPIAGLEAAVGIIALAVAYRSRVVVWTIPPAAAVLALWLAPVGRDAHRLGGFVNTTREASISLTPAEAATALFTLIVLAVAGIVWLREAQPPPAWRSLVAVSAAAVVPLAASGLPGGRIAQTLPALSRGIHYLPALALVLALPAGAGAAEAVRRAGRLAPAAAVVIGAAAFMSPVTAAAGMAAVLSYRHDHPMLSCTRPLPFGPHDTVALIPAPSLPGQNLESLGLTVFASTGAGELYIPRPRIRFRNIFRHIPSQSSRLAAVNAIAAGGVPPGDVTGVLAPSSLHVSPSLRPAASCTVHTYADGRWWSSDFTAYVQEPSA
jgi:hypothetical protein